VDVAVDTAVPPKPKPFWRLELSRRRKTKVKVKDEESTDGEAAVVAAAAVAAVTATSDDSEDEEANKKRRLPRPRLERPAKRVKREKSGHSAHQKRLTGLKIGASQLAAARVSNGGAPELHQVARAELEPGIIVGGDLREPEKLTAALRAFFKQHKLPKRGVRLGIANNRIGVRTFEIVDIDDPKQLANAVKFRAQDALPIPLDEAVLDFQILEERTDEEGRSVKRVLLVVAYKELVDRYAVACRKAGLELVGVDLEAFALLRAMAAPREGDQPAEASATSARRSPSRTAASVSLRACSSGAAGR
jgi:hypothetical protein